MVLIPASARSFAPYGMPGSTRFHLAKVATIPGITQNRDGPHHGDWPYVILNGTAADAFIALGAALKEGLPIRSIEQRWFVYPEAPGVPVGPQWRITFWRKATVSQ